MSISFGSTGIKPYVGSKEVKEAYVGSQKVYSAAPPVYYGFLGAENDYVIADWCQLTRGAKIEKDQGIYRIELSRAKNDSGCVTLVNPKTRYLKFTAKLITTAVQISITYIFGNGKKESHSITGLNTNNYTLLGYTLPENTTEVQIICGGSFATKGLYIDDLRFETE